MEISKTTKNNLKNLCSAFTKLATTKDPIKKSNDLNKLQNSLDELKEITLSSMGLLAPIFDPFYSNYIQKHSIKPLNETKLEQNNLPVNYQTEIKKQQKTIFDNYIHATPIFYDKQNENIWKLDCFSFSPVCFKSERFFYSLPEMAFNSYGGRNFQADGKSCRIFALKILNRLEKQDPITKKTYKELSYTDAETKTCYVHPMVFAMSQSDKFLTSYIEKYVDDMPESFFKENYAEQQNFIPQERKNLTEQLTNQIQDYRNTHQGKGRIFYYALKMHLERVEDCTDIQEFSELIRFILNNTSANVINDIKEHNTFDKLNKAIDFFKENSCQTTNNIPKNHQSPQHSEEKF